MKGFLLILFTVFLTSCEVVKGIFKAGFGLGVFVVVIIVAVILFFVFRGKKQ